MESGDCQNNIPENRKRSVRSLHLSGGSMKLNHLSVINMASRCQPQPPEDVCNLVQKLLPKKSNSPSQSLTPNQFLEDNSESGSREAILIEACKKAKSLDVHGVRITPAVVVFENTFENQSYTEKVSVQNISESSVTIRIYNPRAWSFRVTPLERGYSLAPGLKITRRLHYTSTKNGIVSSSLPIFINDCVIELPLAAFKGQVFVEIIPTSINFGRVDIGCKPVEKKILIKNVSFCATKFMVDLGRNELDLLVSPLKGWIRPHSSVTISLQLLALTEGQKSSEIWITTDLCQTRIHLEVEACRRNLIVLHPNTISDFTLVDFPMTFYGCRRYQTLVVYNMAAASSAFVVLAEFGVKGVQPFNEAKLNNWSHVNMFDVEPVEGRIRPFEGKIFTFWFNPVISDESGQSGWKSDNVGDVSDYLCAVRIKRIQVEDFGSDIKHSQTLDKNNDEKSTTLPVIYPTQKTSNSNLDVFMQEDIEQADSTDLPEFDEISVLLYLYGEAEIASLTILPDSLYYPHTPVGSSLVKVLQITNHSTNILAYRYVKVPFFDIIPDFKTLAPGTVLDVVVKFHARNIGALKRNLTIEIMAKSNATDGKDFSVIGQMTVKVVGEVKSTTTLPKPKFNPGITPLLTNEVGFMTDEITFASKVEKPRVAMGAVNKTGRPWVVSDALIKFPNDMPQTLRSRPTDAISKTIFKGIEGYVPPVDESLTYTVENLIKKKAHDDWFLNYIRGTAALSIQQDRCCKPRRQKPDLELPVTFQEKELILPREVFVPLTFVQLYHIKVHPELISFGSVTTSKSCSQFLHIDNQNDFKISARIIPITPGIEIQTLENFVIDEKTETKVMLTFKRETLGRYSGTVTCVINGYHSFDIAVIAEVVHRSLTINPENVEIKIPEVPFAPTFVPVAINNPLNIPVTFNWVVPEESPIKLEPVIGVAPKRGMVWCVAYFEPETPNYKLHPIKLLVEGTMCLKMKTGVVLPKTNVYFLESVFNIGYIPMNITTIRRFVIFNPDFSDAMFVVLNKEPVKGVKVKPAAGSIKARSCHSLVLSITVTSERSLDFTVFVNLQNTSTIEMKVVGTVVFPQVEIHPKYINLMRIPCNSVTRTTMMAENRSKAKAEICFEMEDLPQFKVSLSKRHHDPGLTNRGFSLEPGELRKFYLHFIPKDLASYDFYLPVIVNNLYSRLSTAQKDLDTHKMIKCFYRSASCDIRKTASCSIDKNALMSNWVLVDVVVLKASLVISESEIFFSHTSESKSFTIKNTYDQPFSIILRCDDSQTYFQFHVDRDEAIKERGSIHFSLLPGESIEYTATLTMSPPGTYITDVAVMIMTDSHTSVYSSVRLNGCIPCPCEISCPLNHVYFQPVPLGVEMSFLFHLNVIHQMQKRETAIKQEIKQPFADLFLVEFPRGNTISGITKTTIPVKITFKSAFPISLRKPVIFRAGRYSECSVIMVATSDNCIITTHAFLNTHTLHQRRLAEYEELSEKPNLSPEDKKLIHLPSIFKNKTSVNQGSSSGSSDASMMSLKTIRSGTGLFKKMSFNEGKSSMVVYGSSSVVVGSEWKKLSTSDVDLSLDLSGHEDKPVESPKQSQLLGQVVTKEDEDCIFPMFPVEGSATENAVHMRKTLDAVQQWVYEQVFCCSYYPFFGSYSFSSFSVVKKDFSHSTPVALRNVFDALERICGRRIRRYFTPIDKIPEDKVAKAVFTYNVYKQLIDFMIAQGALMSHVEPKYLMVYEEYCNYTSEDPMASSTQELGNEVTNEVESSPNIMSQETFLSISVQCWLDLFLQMFKTLVLGPAVGVVYKNADPSLEMPQKKMTGQEVDLKKSLYSKAEETLMSWLTHLYNSQRTLMWPDKLPPPRTVTNFKVDLEDGLILTAVTAAYCPYLTQLYFQDMFLNPTTISQAYHNTTCLTTAWSSIKLGFSITPRDFVQPNSVQMLILVTHLYKILPSYKPEATISFMAILNASESQIVSLTNDEEVSVNYHVEILPNTASFVLNDCSNTFVLKRKSKGQITVQYTARSTNKAEAILLLCGACMPPKFGRNYVFKLEGYPVKLPVSSAYRIISPQNTPVVSSISIESPHVLDLKGDETVSYDIWIAYTEPQPGNLNALSWAKEKKRKIPRRFFILSNELTMYCTKKLTGCGELAYKVCCFSQIVQNFWLIFRNQVIGDFIVKLQISSKRPECTSNLYLRINPSTKCNCVTDRTSLCPKTAIINVPCRNLEQWAAVRAMFELSISPAEKEFWAVYIETNIGFRLLQWMLEDKKEKLNEELELLFKKSKTYKVNCHSPYISCISTLHIPDVRAKSTVPISIHCEENMPDTITTLTLTSLDGYEIRCYCLKITNHQLTH